MTGQRRVHADTRLRDSPEDRVGLMLPATISERVDDLVALADESGERTNRKELIAALILGATTAGEELAAVVRRYRRATVRDALLHPEGAGGLIYLPPRGPGPRPRAKRPPNPTQTR